MGSLHGVNVVLLGVAPSQEEVGDWCGLIRPEGVHSWGFSIQALTNFDYAMPCRLQPFSRGEELQHLHGKKTSLRSAIHHGWAFGLGIGGIPRPRRLICTVGHIRRECLQKLKSPD